MSFRIEPRWVREDTSLEVPSKQPRPRCRCEQGAWPWLPCCSWYLLPQRGKLGSVCTLWTGASSGTGSQRRLTETDLDMQFLPLLFSLLLALFLKGGF